MRCAETLAIAARTGRPVELHPRNRNRRLQIEVALACFQRRGGSDQILLGRRVFELEADDEQAGADGESLRRMVGGRRDGTEEERGVRERRAR